MILELEKQASQQPAYPNVAGLVEVVGRLELADPLVDYSRVSDLTDRLGHVVARQAFFLQAGSCAEDFTSGSEKVHGLMNVVLPMTVTIMHQSGLEVVKAPRIAGQYAKPRSAPTETIDGLELPSFRGVIVNDSEFTESARTPDPERMQLAYDHAMHTLKTLSELSEHGYADLENMHKWNEQLFKEATGDQLDHYKEIEQEIGRALRFMRSSGVNVEDLRQLHVAEVFSSHEALLLDYELALIRRAENGAVYDSSAHMLWIGERTRELDGAHVEFASEIANPIAVKVGPTITADELLALIEVLNPNNIPGRLTLISRMGKEKVREQLPKLMRATKAGGLAVIWSCDPMHGNTITQNGYKTRRFSDIVEETGGFFDVAGEEGEWPGGVHIEVTGDDVTECVGGSVAAVNADNLNQRYRTLVDPRMNGRQTLEYGFIIADRLKGFIKG